jgi:dTDP-glucose pyrophosphorylase
MIIASDNIIEFDLNQLIMLQDKKGSSVFAAYDFHETSTVKKKYGVVRLDSDNKLLSFTEKPDNPESSIAATGIYLIKNEDIQHIRMLHTRPHAGELNLGDMIVEILSQNVTVYCLLVPKWFDIGSIDDLRKANDEYATK